MRTPKRGRARRPGFFYVGSRWGEMFKATSRKNQVFARMERCDEDFESRLRALERLSGGEGGGGAAAFGGVVGGVVGSDCAGVWRGGRGEKCYEMMTSQSAHLLTGNVTECNSHTLDHICHAYDWALRTSNDTATHNNYIFHTNTP